MPAVVATVVLLSAWRPWRYAAHVPEPSWGGGLALSLGLMAGYGGIVGLPVLPPREMTHALFYLALAGATPGIAQTLWPNRFWPRWLLRVFMSAIAAWFLAWLCPTADSDPRRAETGFWLTGLSAAIFLYWIAFENITARLPGAAPPFALFFVAAGAGMICFFSANARLTYLSWTLAAALLAGGILAWQHRRLSPLRGAAAAFVFLFAGLLLTSYFNNMAVCR